MAESVSFLLRNAPNNYLTQGIFLFSLMFFYWIYIYHASERYGSFLFSSTFGVGFNNAMEPLAFHI